MLTSAAAGLIISLTAFRLRGLFLALITFAFAYAAKVMVFSNDDIISFAGVFVHRPSFFGWDLKDDRNFLIFCSAIVVLCILLVGAILKGPGERPADAERR